MSDAAAMLSAVRIVNARKDMERHGAHECEAQRCLPILSEHDLIQKGLLSPLDPILCPSVYVCRFGQIHVCTADACDAYIGTHTGTCPLTGAYHGHTRGDTGYIPIEKRTGGYKRGDKRVPLIKEQQKDIATLVTPANGFASIFSSGRPVVVVHPSHRAEAPAPQVAAASAAVVVVAPDNSKKPTRRETKKRQRDTDIQMSEKKIQRLSACAEEIIVQLLYSADRAAINQAKRDQLASERDQIVKNYYNERRNVTFPIMVDVVNIYAGFAVLTPHLVVLKRDDDRIQRYVKMSLFTWETVIRSPWGKDNPGTRFESHVMSLLYRMRRGLVLNGVEIIPQDKYMFYLPLRIDLPLYGVKYESGTVTQGMKNLKSAYVSAVQAGINPDTLVVRV